MTDNELFQIRIDLIRCYLIANELDGVLLSRVDNFAMATGGKRNYVNLAGDLGACGLLVRREQPAVLISNEIEAQRMIDEEVGHFDCEVLRYPWHLGSPAAIAQRDFKGKFASDDGSLGQNVHNDLADLRALLTESELEKYRILGGMAAFAMQSVLDSIEAGDFEAEIAARLVAAGTGCGFHVPVYLIAADERIAKYRHPLPTLNGIVDGKASSRTVRRYVMVVGGFQRDGLNVSMTRFKRFEDLGPELDDAYERICCVDALMQEATRPEETLGSVFETGQRAYVQFGFAKDEWQNHHQGGVTGYSARVVKGAPGATFRILDKTWASQLRNTFKKEVSFGQAYAWNPSGPGVKSEDSFLLRTDGSREIITSTPNLPQVDLQKRLGRDTEVTKSGMAS